MMAMSLWLQVVVAFQYAHRLQPERFELAASARLGRREGRLGLGVGHSSRDAGGVEHLGHQRPGEPEPDHRLREAATAERAVLHPPHQFAELSLVHAPILPGADHVSLYHWARASRSSATR